MRLPWLLADAEALGRAFDADRLGHAPLLHGPAGIGKRELAQWLVARILCIDAGEPRPCGVCRSCLLLKAGTHPDLFLAKVPEDKTQITVDIIRELSAGLQLTPSIGRHRVGLIDPAERMNANAANALLKTLEEPASLVWLVMVSDRPDVLPATVRSRCQKIAIRPPPRHAASAWLAAHSAHSGPEQIALALDVCADAPLKALDLLQGNGLRFGMEVRRVLQELAAGRPMGAATIDSWAQTPLDTWTWIAHWLGEWLGILTRARVAEANDALKEFCRPSDLARAWQRAIRARQLTDSSVRNDLLLAKWLLEWEGIFATRK